MATILQPRHQQQLESFWNLILASDADVQRGLYLLMSHKYGKKEVGSKKSTLPFIELRGILKTSDDGTTDQEVLEEYFHEKYGV